VRIALSQFTLRTLRRSPLHHGIVLAGLVAAAGCIVNAALVSGFPPEPVVQRADVALPWITVWAPMTLIFMAVPAVRLALSVPMDLRANWVFRMTEDGATRADAIAAAVRTLFGLGVALPIVLVTPLQAWLLGWPAARLIVIECLLGWLLVEIYMREWRRIPFTCAYLPGKGFVPHTVVKAVGAYLLFTGLSSELLQRSSAQIVAMVTGGLVIGALAATLRVSRVRHAALGALIFEDELPTNVITLRLGGT
jgi:hypothetical protein